MQPAFARHHASFPCDAQSRNIVRQVGRTCACGPACLVFQILIVDRRFGALRNLLPVDAIRRGPARPAKRQGRLNSIDQIVLSLTAKGLTTGEVSAHFAEIYGASVGKDQVSRISDAVIAEMTEWQNRPSTGSTRSCSSTRSW